MTPEEADHRQPQATLQPGEAAQHEEGVGEHEKEPSDHQGPIKEYGLRISR